MTDDERLMQQALEALDYEAERGNDDGYRQLRDALRERLAQPHRTHWEGCDEVHPECRKQEQEPVAWRWKERINGDFDSWVISASEPPPYAIEQQPLYIIPPQRKPLTDEMVKRMKENCTSMEMRGAFADGWLSAEAAHGIKGEA